MRSRALENMPTYVYECQTCHSVFEAEQRITEDPLKDCNCGAVGSLVRLIQPPAVLFKGSGFYINDSSGSSTKPAEVETASPSVGVPSSTGAESTAESTTSNAE